MIKNELLLKIYEAAGMQRWNDQIRAFDITELDKQAHKMIAAYVLGKCHDKNVDWIKIIEAGLFEYLQRIILTDIKPPLFYEIKKDRQKYKKLNLWVYERIHPFIECMGKSFCDNFYYYITSESGEKKGGNNNKKDGGWEIARKIIGAAHFYITKWEFDLINNFNPDGYQASEIKKSIESQQEKYKDLEAMQVLLDTPGLISFINICGQLRFQIRWSHIYRLPKTSVLGHMLIVAIFSYLFSYDSNLNKDKILSKEKMTNNYFTGLFHDLPEVLTRDIINPVKKSVEGLDDLIKEYEKKEMEKRIYKLIPKKWHSDFRMFTENEFKDTGVRDGRLVKAADDLAAFIEAYLCKKNGINNESLSEAMVNLENKYSSSENSVISGINLASIYEEFKCF